MSDLISGGSILSYKLSIPEDSQSSCCVVFVHAAEGNMLGPHRMFVEIERNLNSNGIACLRFDLEGCGDSTGESEYNHERDLANVNDVMEFLSETIEFDNIVLLGMSRGAHTALKYFQTHVNNVKGLILLSLPVSSNGVLKKALVHRIKEYILKLTSRKTYTKFVKNQINYKLVFKTIFQGFLNKRSYSVRPAGELPDCPVLLVYGENDPVTFESKDYYLSFFESASSDVVCKVIDGANHSFFHYMWKEEIIENIQNWVEERFQSNV